MKLKDGYQKKFNKALAVPKTWEDYAQVVGTVRAALDAEAFAAVWAAGQAWTVEDIGNYPYQNLCL